ncbi:TspO/MBR-like protein [Rickenella mellea]|uniref:TspO/MBR-like protein n=1 Tax=Rickenella mellea TaxID=50990 RepID=A0A4R5XEL3_9AGAM|nr:TspO/MBR-like protein [Rickenella mellea]
MSVWLPNFLLTIARNPVTALGLPLALGSLSGASTAKVVRGQWYRSLYMPPGQPPRQTFGIVWPVLYLSMGYASYLATQAIDEAPATLVADAKLGLALYYGQLCFNVLWTPLFFGWKQPGIALLDISFLTGTTYYATALLHHATGGKSTYFLVPYCMWLTFATYLNGGIWWLNRGRVLDKVD